eukprot:CAMPEP_0174272326 /NCGR_PEP_ID=MMETSP0439-20130205/50869_1 /TAXON_ID=0 /ORGANISM="Stereomyxa ramosa, Strain Chinc5" /LENGTH=77 /DNA_ID=CAMNT_0015362813 /DNA_START=1 /DNA_END=231 /DNA_ORIENTATION=-
MQLSLDDPDDVIKMTSRATRMAEWAGNKQNSVRAMVAKELKRIKDEKEKQKLARPPSFTLFSQITTEETLKSTIRFT